MSEKRHEERKGREREEGEGGLTQNNWAIDLDSVTQVSCKHFKVIMSFHFLAQCLFKSK
jgi:hypothetical protein